jgi:transcriptional regulator PpsR
MPRTPGAKFVLGALDASGVTRLVAAASDVALVLDGRGVILEALMPGDSAVAVEARSWSGKGWLQTVSADSQLKVEALLRDSLAAVESGTTARARQVNHRLLDGEELPVLYTAVALPADPQGRSEAAVVAIGRDLRPNVSLQRRLVDTQQTMERDYWRFREAETRYRHLLETTSEAVLVVDGSTQKVLEANPAARQLCAAVRSRLVGATLVSLFDAAQGDRIQDLLAAARSVGKQDPMPTRLADGGAELSIAASVFRQDDTAYVLVRLAPLHGDAALVAVGTRKRSGPARQAHWDAMLAAFVQQSPDALVFCDAAGLVLSANRAFLALTELSGEDQARGQPLDRWLGRTGVELGVLITNLRQRGSVGRFVTSLRGEYGTAVEVEIAGAQLMSDEQPVLAFTIRDIERRLKPEPEVGKAMTRSVTELTELVGRTPLKDIVAETTDLIEQLCIETALTMSNDNRASAAMLLGLSRQSLYVKLRRYGMGSLGADE